MPIKIATSRSGKVTIDATAVSQIIRTIANNEIGVASFDPLIAHHSTAENATGDMDHVIREFARIANVTDCAVEIVHHTRKPAPGQEELSVIDSRGAGAIINAVRSARVLNTMSKGEADKVRLDDVERRLRFRIDNGKANMAPPTAARWHKFVSVELPNGDNVGVVEAWQFPGQGGAPSAEMAEAERTAESVFMALLVRFALEGRKASASVGVNYAPHVFAKEPEAREAKVGKAALGEAMRRLFATRRIRVETEGAGQHERTRIVII
jgi:RecA-family ATPase